MSGATVVRITLGKILKISSNPGVASIAILRNAVAGEVLTANNIGEQSVIDSLLYGEAGIDSGVGGYTSVAVGYLPASGTLALATSGLFQR